MLELSAFATGAIVMIYELVGSRIMAPFFGTSIIVWTGLIGVILGSLSLGYYWGGRLADKRPSKERLSAIFFSSAVFMVFTLAAKGPSLFLLSRLNIGFGAFASSALLFGPASILLGMASPYIVRLKLSGQESSGATVGRFYALSTLGSIAGTFAAGFLIIPAFGSSKVLILLASLLFALSLAVFFSGRYNRARNLAGIFVCSIFYFAPLNDGFPGLIADIETRYGRYLVLDGVDYAHPERKVRRLKTDPHGIQSAVYLDSEFIEESVHKYAEYFKMADLFSPFPQSALLIGGGAYAFANDFSGRHPESELDIVEIDPELEKISERFFGYIPRRNTRTFAMDGRVFLNTYADEKRYDAIFMDAFNAHISLPFQLTTDEAVGKMHRMLKSDGVLITNLISALEGERGLFFLSEYATYKKWFPEVHVFAFNLNNPSALQNIILIAPKNSGFDIAEISTDERFEFYWDGKAAPADILYDDYAPVDFFALKALAK